MPREIRSYPLAVVCVWAALACAALFYTRQHPTDHWILTAALPAFAAETVFYLGTMFRSTRVWFAGALNARSQALCLWLSALLPYLIYAAGAATLSKNAFALLAVLTGILAYWFILMPRRIAYDFGFLVLAAAPVALQIFGRIYVSPDPHFRGVQVLGHLSWFRLAIAALLIVREWDPGEFGMWPKAREWRIGLLYYVASILPIAAIALTLRDVHFESPGGNEWGRLAVLAVGTFFGILWVVALGEELLFRGVIERFLLKAWRSPVLAILISAILFGVAHLWYHAFPNWRRALVATALGIACGTAYARTGSVRVPMVTHAFVVTTWRLFFRS